MKLVGASVEPLDEALDVFLQSHLLARLDQMLAAHAPEVGIVAGPAALEAGVDRTPFQRYSRSPMVLSHGTSTPSATEPRRMLDMPAQPVDAGSEEYNAVRPRFFFVVARTRLDLFGMIRRQFRDDRTVYVLLDRREQDRRCKPTHVDFPDRRSADRRRPKDYWEDPAHHPAVLIPLSLPRPATSDSDISRSAAAPEQDKEPTMERVLVDEARVLAWLQEGRYVLHHVLPAILAEHDALETQLHDATRRCRALQEENDGLRDSVGLFLTQLTHVLEPMRDLAEKLGQASRRG